MAFLQTFRNTQQIRQFTVCGTGTDTPKLQINTLLSNFALQIQIKCCRYLEITTGPDSIW